MADVFVSYKREDRATAQEVVRALGEAGYSTWWDDRLTPRTSWDAELESQIRSANAILVLWTRRSIVEDTFVRNEADYAKEHGKLVPAKLERCDVPLAFRMRQAADLTDWDRSDPTHAEWQRVLGWIGELVGRPPEDAVAARIARDEAHRAEFHRGLDHDIVAVGPIKLKPKAEIAADSPAPGQSQRKPTWLWLVGLLVLAVGIFFWLSSRGAGYPASYRTNFVQACQMNGSTGAHCLCVWEKVESEIPVSEFVAADAALQAGQEHPMRAQILGFHEACRAQP